MKRTPEQIAADNAVEEALAQLMVAYERESHQAGASLLNWLIITHSAAFDDDAELSTEFCSVFTSPGCMLPTATGLLALGAENLATYGEDEDEGDDG